MAKKKPTITDEPLPELKLDIGCGPNKAEGFKGVDIIAFPGVDFIFHAGKEKWPFTDGRITEARASHFLEHLTNWEGKWERTHFFNELYRVLKVGGKCQLIFPHWCSQRYYGDPTHREVFSEMGFFYLKKDWRLSQAPHTDIQHNKYGYNCHFHADWGYSIRQDILVRSQDYQQNAMANYKEVLQDIIATLTKLEMPKDG